MNEGPFPAPELIDMVERLDIGVLCLDEDLHVTYANPACSRLVKKPHEEIVHKPLGRIMPRAAVKRLTREVGLAKQDGRTATFEMYFPHPADLMLRVRCVPGSRGANLLLEDTTPERGPEESSARPEDLYQMLSDVMNQRVMEFNKNHRLVSANKTAAEIMDIDPERMKGMTVMQLFSLHAGGIDPDGLVGKTINLMVARGLSGWRPSKQVHVRLRNPRMGKKRWFSLDSAVQPGKPGDGSDRVIIILSDIDEMKENQASLEIAKLDLEQAVKSRTRELTRANRMLEEQKEILRKVIDSIPVMLILYDAAGKVRLVNSEVELLTGWTSDRILDVDILFSLFPNPTELGEFWSAMTQAEPGWQDFRITTRQGTVLESSWTSTRLTDGSTIAIGIDVSARREMEQDLRRLAAAIEQAGEGIVLLDRTHVIRYVNRAFEKICEKSRDEVVGRSLDSLQDEFRDNGSEEGRLRIIDLMKSGEGTSSGVFRLKHRDGSEVSVTVSTAPVYDKPGNVINYVVSLRDVTEMLNLQDRLSQAQKMEAIGALAGGIAHDLRNTFTPILLNTEILMLDLGERSPLFPVLEEIRTATLHGVDLVNHILTFSRQRPQPKRPLDIVPVIREALSFLRSSLPSTIKIRGSLRTENATVLADATQIKQILINLGSNAGHAMRDKGGVLEVDLADVTLDGQAALRVSPGLVPGRYLEIRISDTGVGMDRRTIGSIFNPFFTTKGPGEGTGLGLSVVHGIVKDHKGAVTVRSRPGKGTVFAVYLPVV